MSDLFKVAGPDGEPSSSLILIHGLGGHHHEKPWNVDETFWPFWLARDRQELAIYVIGYRAPVSRLLGTAMHWADQASSILARLLAEPALAHGPLIFIGHSLGGLMVKQLLRTADSTARYAAASRPGHVWIAQPTAPPGVLGAFCRGGWGKGQPAPATRCTAYPAPTRISAAR